MAVELLKPCMDPEGVVGHQAGAVYVQIKAFMSHAERAFGTNLADCGIGLGSPVFSCCSDIEDDKQATLKITCFVGDKGQFSGTILVKS